MVGRWLEGSNSLVNIGPLSLGDLDDFICRVLDVLLNA